MSAAHSTAAGSVDVLVTSVGAAVDVGSIIICVKATDLGI